MTSSQEAEHRRPLTKDLIVETALAVIDHDGLEALSMRRLGADLGVEAMSLYNHFESKEALLQAVTDQLISRTSTPTGGEWKDRVAERYSSMRREIKRHPNVLPLLVRNHAHSMASFKAIEEGLALLKEAGFDAEGTILANRILGAFAIGSAVIESGEPIRESERDSKIAHHDLPADEFPTLHELHTVHKECDFDEGFDRSIRVIIDAVEHHFRRPPD